MSATYLEKSRKSSSDIWEEARSRQKLVNNAVDFNQTLHLFAQGKNSGALCLSCEKIVSTAVSWAPTTRCFYPRIL